MMDQDGSAILDERFPGDKSKGRICPAWGHYYIRIHSHWYHLSLCLGQLVLPWWEYRCDSGPLET